jgi:hypothetical protein
MSSKQISGKSRHFKALQISSNYGPYSLDDCTSWTLSSIFRSPTLPPVMEDCAHQPARLPVGADRVDRVDRTSQNWAELNFFVWFLLEHTKTYCDGSPISGPNNHTNPAVLPDGTPHRSATRDGPEKLSGTPRFDWRRSEKCPCNRVRPLKRVRDRPWNIVRAGSGSAQRRLSEDVGDRARRRGCGDERAW